MSGGYSRAERALHALLEATPTPELSKARQLGPDWNMREALLVIDYAGQLSFVIERPESLPKIDPRLGDSLPVSWIASASGNPHARIKVDCPDVALRPTFLSLIGEVLDKVDAKRGTVYLEFSKVVDDWRRALHIAHKGISRQRVMGLFGELVVLRDLVRLHGCDVVSIWRGPDGHRHDFARLNALEVKTYSGSGSPKVTIHGASQLDPPVGRDLHLVALRVEESGDGETIAEVVRELVSSGAHVDTMRLRAGEDDPLVLDDSLSLLVTGRSLYHVGADFPGIRASRLDETSLKGVEHLAYVLLLDACPDKLPEAMYESVLEALWPAH